MTFIKEILNGVVSDFSHKMFSRFGKGKFENRALVEIKRGKKFSVKTSFEYVNDLVKLIIDNCSGDVKVSGSIVGKDLSKELDLEAEHKKRMGVCKADLKPIVLSKEKLQELYDTYGSNYLLLNLDGGNCSLKSKQSLPKPGQALLDGGFCKASFERNLSDVFLWEKRNFKKGIVSHDFVIEGFIVPDEYKDDSAKARLFAKRKGKIIRTIDVDGKKDEIVKEVAV